MRQRPPVIWVIIFLVAGLASPAAEVQVQVDASKPVRTLDARHFGVNTAMWDGILDTPETVSIMREMGVQCLRFPGGSFSDRYHWATSTIDKETQPTATSFSDFARVATNLNARVFITVNYGSGTPKEAAGWVRHSNITNRYDFKYWEIGNECYGNWEYDENIPPHNPITYATRAKDYFTQMKAADPSIKIGVVVTESFKDRGGVVLDALKSLSVGKAVAEHYRGWTSAMLNKLKQLGVTPDFLIYRLYPQSFSGFEDDASLLQSTSQWSTDAAKLRQRLKDCFGNSHTNIEIICNENNSIPMNTGKQTTSLVNGLYLADSFGQLIQTEFNSYLWWDFRNMQDKSHNNSRSLYGWRQYGDHGMLSGNDTRYPTFYTFKLLQYFARAGDQIVRASSDHKLLSVYAARRADGSMSLLAINKSPSKTLSANISLTSFTPQPNATLFSYGIPQDEAARTETGSQDIARTNLTGIASTFTLTYPPYSASVIVLTPKVK